MATDTRTSDTWVANSASSTGHSVQIVLGTVARNVGAPIARAADPKKKALESAVYGYIRAIRALGRTTVNTLAVAQALGVSEVDVQSTLDALKRKGVKIAA